MAGATPRNSTQSRSASRSSKGNVRFTENTGIPVQEFLDDVVDNGGRFVDFRYNVNGSNGGKTCLLVVKMSKVNANGEEVLSNESIFASPEAHEALIKQKGTDEPLKGITVSEFYETDQTTGKETGNTKWMLCKQSGESTSLADLGLRI